MLDLTTKVYDVQNILSVERRNNKSIGFVPTMGALHEGHLSLIRRSRSENDVTVASIFVNPTQFNDSSDYARYPRTIEKDRAMLEEAGCNILFCPPESEIYSSPELKNIDFNPGTVADVLEGAHRPGHFQGVAAVVKRLFDIIQPDNAYFGAKDYQQLLIIKKLVQFYHLPIQVIGCETLREPNGLAMSSRNMLLSPAERSEAAFLYQMLQKAKGLVLSGKTDKQGIIDIIMTDFEQNGNFKLDYFDICSAESLQSASDLSQKDLVMCVAAFLGKVRLIDNIVL